MKPTTLVLPLAKVLFLLIEGKFIREKAKDDRNSLEKEANIFKYLESLNEAIDNSIKGERKVDLRQHLYGKIKQQEKIIEKRKKTIQISGKSWEIFTEYLGLEGIADLIDHVYRDMDNYIHSDTNIKTKNKKLDAIKDFPKDRSEWEERIKQQRDENSPESEIEKIRKIQGKYIKPNKNAEGFFYVFFYDGEGISFAKLDLSTPDNVILSYFDEKEYPEKIDRNRMTGRLIHDEITGFGYIQMQQLLPLNKQAFHVLKTGHLRSIEKDTVKGVFSSVDEQSNPICGNIILKKILNDHVRPFEEIESPTLDLLSFGEIQELNDTRLTAKNDFEFMTPDSLVKIFGIYETVHLDAENGDILFGCMKITKDFKIEWSTAKNFYYTGNLNIPPRKSNLCNIRIQNIENSFHSFHLILFEDVLTFEVPNLFQGLLAGRSSRNLTPEAEEILLFKKCPVEYLQDWHNYIKKNDKRRGFPFIISLEKVTSAGTLLQEYIRFREEDLSLMSKNVEEKETNEFIRKTELPLLFEKIYEYLNIEGRSTK